MMRLECMCIVAIAAMVDPTTPARADDASNDAAKQVAGLFMQSCIQFAGDKDGLRAWARRLGLKVLPGNAQEHFLYGLPGVVFDASNKEGKFVVVSEDGGSCSVVAERTNGPAVIADLEQDMNDAKISLKLTGERIDTEEKALMHREYLAAQGDRAWLLLISTVKNTAGGQAMLTANRN
jgi:hypothetical protein